MKGQVYKAKRKMWYHHVITVLLSTIVWYYMNNLLTGGVKPDDPNMSLYIGISIFIGVMFGVVYWLVGVIFIWGDVNSRNAKLKGDRYRHHFNRCIDLFKEGEYDKIKQIYDNYLIESGYDELTSKIRLAWRVSKLKDLDDEKLIPARDITPDE